MAVNQAKNNTVARVKNLITGTAKRYPNGSQELFFGGTTRTVSAITLLLQSFVELREAVIAQQAATRTKVAAERAQAPALLAVIDEYVAFVRASFGAQPEALVDFGLAPRKARLPLTTEQKAVALAKRKATRAARGTLGKKQKKAVKGNVTGVVVSPVTSPKAETPAATPAPAGTSPQAAPVTAPR